MPSLIEIRHVTSMWTPRRPAGPQVNWLKYEVLALMIGCAVAAAIYLVDVKPKVKQVRSRPGTHQGPYGPW